MLAQRITFRSMLHLILILAVQLAIKFYPHRKNTDGRWQIANFTHCLSTPRYWFHYLEERLIKITFDLIGFAKCTVYNSFNGIQEKGITAKAKENETDKKGTGKTMAANKDQPDADRSVEHPSKKRARNLSRRVTWHFTIISDNFKKIFFTSRRSPLILCNDDNKCRL